VRQRPKGENGGSRYNRASKYQAPSNFALIKEEVGSVAGYVGVLFFFTEPLLQIAIKKM